MPREKSRHRDRRSSSYSSDSSYERKKSKSKHKRRSRSRDRSESSSKRRRSHSRSKRRRSSSRSLSRDRYESKSRRRSRSRSKRSRDRSLSRSSSISKSKYKQKQRSRRSRSDSRSSSLEKSSHPRKFNLNDTETKVEKAIKAANAAGLTMSKIPTYDYKEVTIKEDMPTMQDRDLLAELNSDTFKQKSFTSSRSNKQQNIVIDLDNDTVKLPENEVKDAEEDTIFDFSALPSEEELREMWVTKLYLFRKKMLKGESNNVIN